ncbi:MAG TPA: serine protease, partial [Burkholderiaceae bacterium]|nr:serine protease [Burkholderiaceae bacterium]
IELGQASVAVDVLEALARRQPQGSRDWGEAKGLLGRAWKQIFIDAGDKSSGHAHAALLAAITAYREACEASPDNTWQGVNLLALLYRGRQMGLQLAVEYGIKGLARGLVDTLEQTPAHDRDEWFAATLAEAAMGLGDWNEAERYLRDYVGREDLPAFAIASTLRQFSEVWGLGQIERGRTLIDILRARQLRVPDAEISLAPEEVRRLQSTPPPSTSQLEALLGKEGPRTYRWWMAGIHSARSVASIWRRLGQRCGTGFLVRAADFGLEPADELLLLTNEHVVNEQGVPPGIRPTDAEVVFEAVEGSPKHAVEGIVWSAPRDRQDTSLLRLKTQPVGIEPLRVASELPKWPPPVDPNAAAPRVYVIGYPGGRELQFSFQDNELLGHEGAPNGRPPVATVCRVHYRAPTEGGSSGSPVFDDTAWEVIALHHLGGQIGMSRLNGEPGTYGANEGIAIDSIVAAIRASRDA